MIARSFNDKVAIVTGAGQGIGYCICKELYEAGATVILNDIDPALAIKAAASINTVSEKCIAMPGDSADLRFIQEMVDKAVDAFGKLDIVIANSGITLFGDFLDYPAESFYKVLNVNLGGSFFLAQRAARQMKEQGNGGSILFTSSVTGHQAHKNLAAYGMTKAALEMLARNLVIEVSEYNISVNCVAPGATLTERTTDDPDYESTWKKITPMKRPATVVDIANAVLFLIADESRQITGQTLIIDGGWTAISPSPF